MRITGQPLDPGVEELIDVPQGKLVAPGSDVAVNPSAPVVTGDPAMDTQLENLRALLCDRVWSVYSTVTRAKKIRLWAMESTWDGGQQRKTIPASMIKRDDHPLVAVMIRQAQELEKIDKISTDSVKVCDGVAQSYADPKYQMMQIQTRLRALADIQQTALKIEELGADALGKAQDLVKAFHAMAQQYRIHRDKLDHQSDQSDLELMRLASQVPAIPKEPA